MKDKKSDLLSILSSTNPLTVLREWLDKAKQESRLKEPWAMELATSAGNTPTLRTVLFKQLKSESLVFFSNYQSLKGRQIEENPKAAALFRWESLGQQIRIQGSVKKTSRKESLKYWQTRPRESQLSQWISRQSETLLSRKQLTDLKSDAESRFKDLSIPCPEHWGGYELVIEKIEFWQNREHRLHDRFLFEKSGSAWNYRRLFP